MKILCFIKEMIDPNAGVEADDYSPAERDKDDIIMNTNDKHAIEAALQLKEKHGGTVVAVTVGSENADKILREAIAMGVDEAVHVELEEFEYLPPLVSSKILAEAAKKIGDFDLILTGMNSLDYNNAAVPSMVAELLGLPHLTFLDDLKIEDGHVVGRRYIEGGSLTIKVKYPLVASIATTANEPRYTSVKRIIQARKTKIPKWSLDDLGLDDDLVETDNLTLRIEEVFEPKAEEREVFKVETDDLEEGVVTLLKKMKEDGWDLLAYREG